MKRAAKIFLFIFVFLFMLTLSQCTSPTGPPPVKPIKDPRTYTWTIDTLKVSFQTSMTRIWGSAPNDVYIGGHDAGAPSSSLWHFDGNKWSVIKLPVSRSYDIYGIFGFSVQDIWTAGNMWYYDIFFKDSSLICHYDGSSWKEYTVVGGRTLLSVWGASPTDIWAGGWYNTLFHFDGTSWKHFPFFIPPQGVQLLSISGLSSNDVYMVGARNDVVQPIDTSFYYLYHFKGTSWNVVDSSYTTPTANRRTFGVRLKRIENVLYSATYGLYKKEGDNWIAINDDPNIFIVGGSSTNNLFAVGAQGTVYNYNGTDWEKIVIKNGFQEPIIDVWTDGTEAFMVATDGSSTYVIHGK